MKTSTAAALALLALAAGGAALWWTLRDRGADDFEVPDGEPVVEAMDPERQRRESHVNPWPFREFDADFKSLRGLDDPVTANEPERIREEKERTLLAKKFPLHLKNATIEEVVKVLQEKVKDTGVSVFTYPTDDAAWFRLDYDADETDVFAVIGVIMERSAGEVGYFTTWQGLCIGTQGAIQQSQLDAREAFARKRAETDRANPILSAPFRVDFDKAYIGPIAENIKEQTGVEVIVDAGTWQKARTLTWRADPMPLREALDRISHLMGFVYRVRDGRVFVLDP